VGILRSRPSLKHTLASKIRNLRKKTRAKIFVFSILRRVRMALKGNCAKEKVSQKMFLAGKER